jgi:hypothetical protein
LNINDIKLEKHKIYQYKNKYKDIMTQI